MTLAFFVYNRDGTMRGSPTNAVLEYQQEHIEGPYVASFALQDGHGVDERGLRAWFDNYLMLEFAAHYNGREVWRGYIWEMQLEMGGEVRIKSMVDMTNSVKTSYKNTSGEQITSSWVENEESIARYGRKERVVTSSDESTEEAEERAEAELQYHASPYTTSIAYRDTAESRLSVSCVGRMVVANNVQLLADAMRYQDADGIGDLDYGDDTTVGAEVERIVKVVGYNASEIIYPLNIAANDTVTAAGVSRTIGGFDRLLELAKLRNSDGEFYRLRVRHDGGVIYEKFTEDVSYLRYPAPRGIETLGETVPMWDAKPGIIKYVDPYGGPPLPDTWLSDKRLAYYERTVMRDGDSIATFHGRELDALDIYRAHEANQRWIESNKPAVKKKPKKKTEGKKDLYGHYIPDEKPKDE